MTAPSNTVFQEARHTGGYVVWDPSDGQLTREPIMLAQGFGLLGAGLVLGLVTATGKYEPYDPTAADGHQTAVAVLFGARDTTNADKRGVANVRGPMKVQAAELQWGPNVTTDAQKSAALTALQALPGGGILHI